MKAALAVLAFFAISFAVYGSSLHNEFVVLDDSYLVYRNPVIRSISPRTIAQAFSTFDPELYIPLTFLSYQVDYAVGGASPTVFHTTSLLLHTLNALLVAGVLYLLTKRSTLSILGGLLFLLHPIHTEAISWISARKDVLSTFFFLLSLGAYLLYRQDERPQTYGASVAFFFLGLLSKVTVLMLPLALVLVDLKERRPFSHRMLLEKIPFLVLSTVFGLVALYGKRKIVESLGLMDTILLSIKSSIFYLQKLLLPIDLSIVYPYDAPITILSPAFFVPTIVLVGILALAIFSAHKQRILLFGIGFFLLTLVPSFVTFQKAGDIFLASDRYAYIPSIGFLFLIVCGLGWLLDKAHLYFSERGAEMGMWGIGAALVIGLGWMAHTQSLLWQSSGTLFLHVLDIYPNSAFARSSLGSYYIQQKRYDDALREFTTILVQRPYSHAYVKRGKIYELQGQNEKALAEYQFAKQADNRDPDAPLAMGSLLAILGRKEEAIPEFEAVLAINPTHTPAMNNLGALELERGNLDHAYSLLRDTISINPYYADAHFNLGLVYQRQNHLEEALLQFQTALSIDPSSPDILMEVAAIYLKQRKIDEAKDALERVLALDPNHQTARALLDAILKAQHTVR